MSAKPEAANDSIAALEHKVETMRHELNIACARAEAYLKLLTGIHALLYPPSIKMADGSVMLFRPQNLDPHAVLQELSDRIRALSDELADPGDERSAAGALRDELEARLESILDASEDDMPLSRAEELAALWVWGAGKLIGGDAHAAAITLHAALAAERERREADETDAARYRWLREWRARWEIRYWNGIYWNQLITDELGAAIDAAIAAERGGK